MSADRPSVVFDPDDSSVIQHRKHGVWDVYKDISAQRSFFSISPRSKWNTIKASFQRSHYLARMLKDIASVPNCLPMLLLYILFELGQSLFPALKLWYTNQILVAVESAVRNGSVDRDTVLRAAGGRVAADLIASAMDAIDSELGRYLEKRIQLYWSIRIVQRTSRLDFPTFTDEITQVQLRRCCSSRVDRQPQLISCISWRTLVQLVVMSTRFIKLASESIVMLSAFCEHSEAPFLLIGSCLSILAGRFQAHILWPPDESVSVFKTTDEDFIGSSGMQSMVSSRKYRKDIVVGGLSEFIGQEYRRRKLAMEGRDIGVHDLDRTKKRFFRRLIQSSGFERPVAALTQLLTCLRAVNSPKTAPFSLAKLELANSAVASLSDTIRGLGSGIESMSSRIDSLAQFYEFLDGSNKIEDGTVPFPESQADLSHGISIEFRNVSFAYSPGQDLALKNVSFKIEQGQLCVIVGENGSGKSTILNPITRIYDSSEGEILLNGLNIRTLKLDDVRKAVAVLSQDYSIFPLKLSENIGCGDLDHAHDRELIEQAAKMGGAEFILDFPYKFDTFVSRPSRDYIEGATSKRSIFYGENVDYSNLKLNDDERDLSGGQKQRIALSRTFMKSLVSPSSNVGLLLFDEPSASLDPKAEHDLFSRLRDLRGRRTMVFSSHRFGKLTRHADLILYLEKGKILEAGNHASLMKKDGEYAQFWNLQAQDFLCHFSDVMYIWPNEIR